MFINQLAIQQQILSPFLNNSIHFNAVCNSNVVINYTRLNLLIILNAYIQSVILLVNTDVK